MDIYANIKSPKIISKIKIDNLSKIDYNEKNIQKNGMYRKLNFHKRNGICKCDFCKNI